jgi:rhodanese-related sulfurtransferase
MTPAELSEQIGEVQLVDVRYANEWDAGRIAEARHIPADELEDRMDELDRSRPVVTLCRSGQRSASAAAQLRAEGFRAENLDGGMEAWAADGHPVVRDGGEAGQVVEPEPPPDDRPEHLQRLEAEFLSVVSDLQAHFGDREASETEIRSFLRDRLISEGRSADEADEFLAQLDRENQPGG